ncbi:MAG: hypothetical protein V2A56_01385 [bacterium]
MKQFFVIAAVLALFAFPLLAQQGQMHGDKDSGMMMHKDMGFVFTADSLYSCPMHPYIVSDNPDAHCTINACGMPLKKMSDEQVKTLREAKQLYVCPMASCSVVTASDTLKNCPVCGMKLVPLERGAKEGKMGSMKSMDHSGHRH